jgi:hypothetical protein
MSTHCETYWNRFVASQVNSQNARSEPERLVWLQVAEMWLIMARAEYVFDTDGRLFSHDQDHKTVN